jgi:hypothetical protein
MNKDQLVTDSESVKSFSYYLKSCYDKQIYSSKYDCVSDFEEFAHLIFDKNICSDQDIIDYDIQCNIYNNIRVFNRDGEIDLKFRNLFNHIIDCSLCHQKTYIVNLTNVSICCLTCKKYTGED